MAAYKSDINLFKAAGGDRAKSKHVSKTKRLLVVVILVLILVGGAVGGLIYYSTTVKAQLTKLVNTNNNYVATTASTRDGLEELADVKRQIVTQNAIEFAYTSNMWTPGLYSDLSNEELRALRSYLSVDGSGYTFMYDFDEVIDLVLNRLNLVAYDDNAVDEYSARFLYNALYYMKTMRTVFAELPYQMAEEDEESYYWYCYYRGKVVMLLKGTDSPVDPIVLINSLHNDLGISPFSTIAPQNNEEITYKYYSVSLEGQTYLALALNSKSVVERFVDTVEQVFDAHTVNDPTVVNYRYKVTDFFLSDASQNDEGELNVLFNVTFSMTQSEYFHLKDVCDALYATPFFANYGNYSFSETDRDEEVSGITLQLILTNQAVSAIRGSALAYFEEMEG